jgi:hypothetical protein
MPNENVARARQIVDELVKILSELSDPEIGDLMASGAIDEILKATLDGSKARQYTNIAEFLLDNKNRAHFVALLREVITRNYSFKAIKDGRTAFVSPFYAQWFDDGVIFLEGQKPWEGITGLYRKGQLSYAVASRDVRPGESFDLRKFLSFIPFDDFVKSLKQIPPTITSLDQPLNELREQLNEHETDEEKYHSWFRRYPWAFGLAYEKFQDLRPLDDRNIPDFTGVRTRDASRDIFEIKQPFLRLFRADGEFTAEFNEAWNQAERYLVFTRQNEDYLFREKGLRFNNPRCYLIAGYDLLDDQKKKVAIKEQSVPSIEFRTYNDVVSFVTNTVSFIKEKRNSSLAYVR